MFGDYIDVYDLTRAVEDGATVPVYFEPRLIKVALASDVTEEQLDTAADEATVGLDDAERARAPTSRHQTGDGPDGANAGPLRAGAAAEMRYGGARPM